MLPELDNLSCNGELFGLFAGGLTFLSESVFFGVSNFSNAYFYIRFFFPRIFSQMYQSTTLEKPRTRNVKYNQIKFIT